jgi:hypothetical protein
MMIWWGIWLLCIPVLEGGYWVCVVSPVFLMILLLSVSGVPLQVEPPHTSFCTLMPLLLFAFFCRRMSALTGLWVLHEGRGMCEGLREHWGIMNAGETGKGEMGA